MRAIYPPLNGARFGSLTVLNVPPVKKDRQIYWKCRCECGSIKLYRGPHLRSGASTSCGHARAEICSATGKNNRTHGLTKSLTWSSYWSAKSRCEHPKAEDVPYYAGVKFKFSSVKELADCIGERPSRQHTLDRFPDNKGHYEPGNVRWATWSEQARNRCERVR